MHYHLSAIDLGYNLPDSTNIFNSLTFSFNPVRTGLIGQNGVGKSTLLDLLAGRLTPSAGTVDVTGKISYLPQNDSITADATVADALRLADALWAHDRIARGEGEDADFEKVENLWDLPERVERVFEQLSVSHLSLEQPVSTISGGELMRVRIARLLVEEPDFILLDEPTNHLDFSARRFVYDLIGEWTKGLVVVSHDRRLLSLVDQIAELDSKGLKFYGGNYAFYKEQRGVEKAAAEQSFAVAKLKLKRAKESARKAAERQERRSASGYKRAIRTGISRMAIGNLQRKAENSASKLKGRHEKKIEDASRDLQEARKSLPVDSQIAVDLNRTAVPASKRMIELEDVNYRYPGAADLLWGRALSLSVFGAERISLEGPNGSGKSTLIRIICGDLEPATGFARVGTSKVGLLDQRVDVLDDRLTVFENLKRIAPTRQEHDLRILLGRFLFYKDTVFKPTAVLSGGERMRAGLACLLGADQSPDILILDEPTNNLDLASIEAVASALRNYRGTLIVVSHDREFLEEIGVERAIVLGGDDV
ncbi:MAG TPA: ABC-F family ATP-binding cassette domain-containing protein [Blastocatellia bacterium]|nr:ABC-F family ATP-binding cassette domain-containing protein [Blastocatellia bacterium]